jgi:hypothetical protein
MEPLSPNHQLTPLELLEIRDKQIQMLKTSTDPKTKLSTIFDNNLNA